MLLPTLPLPALVDVLTFAVEADFVRSTPLLIVRVPDDWTISAASSPISSSLVMAPFSGFGRTEKGCSHAMRGSTPQSRPSGSLAVLDHPTSITGVPAGSARVPSVGPFGRLVKSPWQERVAPLPCPCRY